MALNNIGISVGSYAVTTPVSSSAVYSPIEGENRKSVPNTAVSSGNVSPNATDAELRKEGYGLSEIKEMKRAGKIRCEACDNRTYVDQSGDPGVSFKTPTKLSPAQAATAVASHENEHVARNAAKSERENRTSHSTVRIFTSVCSECNKSYVSGGETRTVSRKKAETQDFAEKFFDENVNKGIGNNIDTKVGE